MGEQIFNVVFILLLLVVLFVPLYLKIKTYKTDDEWEEIKRQNSDSDA